MRTDDTFYIGIPEDEVDSLVALGPALHFYLWLLHGQRRFISQAAEEFEHVGPWVKRGLVVSKFFRSQYAEVAGVSERTVTNYIAHLESIGRIKVVETGRKPGYDITGTPIVAAIGFWTPAGGTKRIPIYTNWMTALGESGEGGKKLLKSIKAIRRDINKIDRKEVAARTPGKNFPEAELGASGKVLPDAGGASGKVLPEVSGKNLLPIPNGSINLTEIPNGSFPASQNSAGQAAPGRLVPKRRTALPKAFVGPVSEVDKALRSEEEAEGAVSPVEPLEEGGMERESVEVAPQPSRGQPAPSRDQERYIAPWEIEPAAEQEVEVAPIAPPTPAPKRPKKTKEAKYPKGAMKSMTDAIIEQCYPEGGVPDSKKRLAGVKAAELLEAGYQPEEVGEIAKFMKRDPFWRDKVTPGSLVSEAPRWRSSSAGKRASQQRLAPEPQAADSTPAMQAELDALSTLWGENPFQGL